MNLCLALASLLFLSPQNDTVTNEQSKKEFKGKVKEVTYYSYSVSNIEKDHINPDTINPEKQTKLVLDKKGNKIERYDYWNDQLSKTYKYKYNDEGKVLEVNYYNYISNISSRETHLYNKDSNEVEWCIYDDKDSLTSRWEWVYHKNGKLDKLVAISDSKVVWDNEYDSLWRKTKLYTYSNDSLTQREFCEYDDENNMVEHTSYIGNERIWQSTFKYDSCGNRIETIRISRNGANTWTKKKLSNENGIKIEKTFFLDSSGVIKFWTSLKIDSINRETESITYNNKNQITRRFVKKKDKNGITISTIMTDSTSNLESASFYEYNDNQDLIVQSNIYPNSNSLYTVYSYEYDSKNNWTRKISYRNRLAHCVEKREFEYFED